MPRSTAAAVLALTATVAVAAAVAAAGAGGPAGRTANPEPRALHGHAPGGRGPHAGDGGRAKTDVVYDLGSGDGRLVITAAKQYGARGVGIELNPALIAESRAMPARPGREPGRVPPAGRPRRRRLARQRGHALPAQRRQPEAAADAQEQLKPGSRIVSHPFGMGDWVPPATETITDQRGTSRLLYLWIVGPA